MNDDRHPRAQSIYLAALEREPDERHAFVDRECESDSRLLAEVTELLERHDNGAVDPESEANRLLDPARTPTLPFQGDSNPDSDPALGETTESANHVRWGGFALLEKLGAGAFGEVYRAFDSKLRREVALKLEGDGKSTKASGQILEEARRVVRIRHPNIVSVHGVDVHDGRMGMWMDLVDGEDLEDLLERHGTLAAREASHIGIEVCRALAAVHEQSMVHQDVKTHNIMRNRRGDILLMDFGCGVVANESRGGMISGTPRYMPPEQLRGAAPHATFDIYALGAVLFRLVTAEYHLELGDTGDWVNRLLNGKRLYLRDLRPDLPTSFVEVIEKALATEPADRFQTVGEMEMALARLTGAPAAKESSPRDARRGRGAMGGVAVAIVIIAGAIFALTRPWELRVEGHWECLKVGSDSPTKLEDGATIRAGDKVYLRVQANMPVFVYILSQDSEGSIFALFPDHSLETTNPIAADTACELPGRRAGEEFAWIFDDKGEKELLRAIFADERIAELEGILAAKPRPPEGGFMTLTLDDVQRGMAKAPKEAPSSRRPAVSILQLGAYVEERIANDPGIVDMRISLSKAR